MGKISPVVAKYIIHSDIDIGGIVDKPDVIGAIFGQTEGLLGADLELRELQRSGRIGRIEVNTATRAGKTTGNITIPSSLDKAETSIIGAALEIIQRIGPCNAKIQVKNIEDVRVSKRNMVIQRAKMLLKMMMDNVIPDSQELSDEVASAVRIMEIVEFGRDRLPAGPTVDESEDVIVVEGRADVLNLLKHGFKNVIAINGSSVPQTIVDLSKKKEVTVFADGDRGGDLIIRELTNTAEIDFVVKAPDGKEVEEITKKEIHKALRGRVSVEQVKLDTTRNGSKEIPTRPQPVRKIQRPFTPPIPRGVVLSVEEKQKFKRILEDLIGTRGAEIVDEKLNILGKVPISELQTALRNTNNIHAIIFDGVINRGLIKSLETSNVKHLVAMDSNVRQNEANINIITSNDL